VCWAPTKIIKKNRKEVRCNLGSETKTRTGKKAPGKRGLRAGVRRFAAGVKRQGTKD